MSKSTERRARLSKPEPEDTEDQATELEGDEPAPGVDSRLANSPEPEYKGMRLGKSVVVNAPTHQNNGGFETKVTAPANAPSDKTAGANASMAANAFEQRVSQEQGSH